MEYITTKEAAEKWGISTTRITVLANKGRIKGAQKLGRSWLIPATATKPLEQNSHYSKNAKDDNFSFPLYHFRPDWSYINKNMLSEQQQQLLAAENAIIECRFDDAYEIAEDIMQAPDDVVTEIGSLWCGGICCIALNKPMVFSKIFLRIQTILNDDFPHRDDLMVVLDSLKTYTESLSTAAREHPYNTDINEQALPLECLLAGYSQMIKETLKPNSTDIIPLELNLRLIKTTGAVAVAEFLHLYLLGIYYVRSDISKAEIHARTLVKIAYENRCYFPLVTYYRYAWEVLAPIIMEYPLDFQNNINELISSYEENFTVFFLSIEEYDTVLKLRDSDFPFIYAVLSNLTNRKTAERMGISQRTVKRRLNEIYKALNVHNKKELRTFLKNNM